MRKITNVTEIKKSKGEKSEGRKSLIVIMRKK